MMMKSVGDPELHAPEDIETNQCPYAPFLEALTK
jgi:hypothetical protein